jgi:MarR family transcriptional regulator, organic hydroperoxide resistance regulator
MVGHLLVRCGRAHRLLTAQRLNALGLASGEDLVLAELWHEDGVTQTELARRLALRRSTVTTVLRTMEARGLVRRVPDGHDARVVRVHHTPRAAALRAGIEEIWRVAETELLRELGGAEVAALRSLLGRVARSDRAW